MSSRLTHRYADHEVVEQLNAFSEMLERGNEEGEPKPDPEADPVWSEIARLEREGREDEARRLERQ